MANAAIQHARNQSKHGPRFDVGMCLREVRTCYGIGASASDAARAWKAAELKHPETDPAKIPRGVPVFWSGGADGHGHVAIATGFNGNCWSTDIKRDGFFDRVPIELVGRLWGLKLLGWTEDLNGVKVPR